MFGSLWPLRKMHRNEIKKTIENHHLINWKKCQGSGQCLRLETIVPELSLILSFKIK